VCGAVFKVQTFCRTSN